jgi:alpha-mannosidase
MYTGKFPLPEATVYSRAVRHGEQADTHDLGILNVWAVEPGLTGNMVFDYAIAADDAFDAVRARQLGAAFNLPLRAEYVQVLPVSLTGSFFSVDQPNVEITTVKPVTENVIRGEVTSAPLNPQVNKAFVIRLQEFAGRGGTVHVTVPAKVRSAAKMSMTEDRVIQRVNDLTPLTVSVRPYETVTLKIEIE